jgi:hypothetical protein
MLSIPGTLKIFPCPSLTDMRESIGGLAGLATVRRYRLCRGNGSCSRHTEATRA